MSMTELGAIMRQAAQTLSRSAGTVVWPEARNGVLAIMRRARRDESATVRLLDATDAAVRAAPPDRQDLVRGDEARDWEVRLRDLAGQDPDAATELLAWAGRIGSALPTAPQQVSQHITASASGATAQGVIHGNIYNHTDPAAD